jgi:hypothetical protein
MPYNYKYDIRWILTPISGSGQNEEARNLATVQKIASFRHLAPGWHYGAGGPIDEKVTDMAFAMLARLTMAGLFDTDAFAGGDGEVMVTAYEGDHYIEIIVEADCTISLTHEYQGKEMFDQERMSEAAAHSELAKIVGEIWTTSVFYTQTTSTVIRSKTASKAWLSVIPQGVAELLFSNALVLTPEENQFVRTQGTFIPHGLGASHPFFGYLTKTSSLRDTA